ncbi:MAG: U32 family peptidase [Clostridia bacterium]|nr:U32 family peptidase [Clostridia bacterium]
MKKSELLAPAGSLDSLKAAVRCGADAVYFGLKDFSAREGAQNISYDELDEAVKFCHLRDSKAYVALNTLLLSREYNEFAKAVERISLAGVDGVIVQDLGAAEIIKSVSPDMPLHASTQMSTHSLEGVRFLARHGFTRVVTARELSRDDVKYICQNTDTEIEVFVHGALCVSYSGKCLLSSMIGRRSGNRGKCAQPCRLPYKMGGSQGYFLSPYDLCLLDDVRDMSEFPVASLKIEGRMKSPSYVALVTSIYRKALDGEKITDDDREELKEIFCRGEHFTRAYYGGEKNIINKNLSNEKTGKTASAKLLSRAKNLSEKEGKRGKISLELTANNNLAVLTAKKSGITVTASAQMTSTPLERERVTEQLAKLGSTPFYAESIEVNGEFGLKISELNELRRKCCEKLENSAQTCPYRIEKFENQIKKSQKQNAKTQISACVRTEEQLKALSGKVKKLYIPLYMTGFTQEINASAALVLPAVIHRGEQKEALKNIQKALERGADEIVCQSVDNIELVKDFKCRKTAGFELNITNPVSLEFYESAGLGGFTLSPELSFEQMRELAHSTQSPVNAVVYGRLPLMLTQVCFMNCKTKDCRAALTDRTNTRFPIQREGNSCRNIIFNSRPLYLADKEYDCYSLSEGIMYFTTESGAECLETIDLYKAKAPFDGEYTRGYQCGGKY